MNVARRLLGALLGLPLLLAATSCTYPQAQSQGSTPAVTRAVQPTARRSSYRGWRTIALDNGLVEVQVAPDIGGRIIQFKLGDFEYLWVNKQLAGQSPPPSGVGPNGEWLNYGGDKLWPAPQGHGENQWPGPPDPVLDGSPHVGRIIVPRGSPVSAQLVSRKDPRTGIQFARLIKVYRGSSRVSMRLMMRNIDERHRRWAIWQVTQHDCGSRTGPGYDRNVWACCPLSRNSRFPKGYQVLCGLANNPSFQLDARRGMMRVHYQRQIGKIGLDSTAGWLAVVNRTHGYAFVTRFRHFPRRPYPHGDSVEFWTNGVGQYVSGGKVVDMTDDPIATPPYLESEVLSPLATVLPGETYNFLVDWYAARIGAGHPVLDCTEAGVVCEEFRARVRRGRLILTGRLGVFYEGTVALRFINVVGNTIGQESGNVQVTPAEPLVLSDRPKLTQGVRVPEDAARVALVILDHHERSLGELAQARVEWFPIAEGALKKPPAPLHRR